MRLLLLAVLATLTLAPDALAVKHEDFKECHQTSFCRRLRSISTRQQEALANKTEFSSPYSLGAPVATASTKGTASWTFPLASSLYPDITFTLRVDVLKAGDGIVRIRADEVDSASQWRRYNETAKWALLDAEPALATSSEVKSTTSNGVTTLNYGSDLSIEIVHAPLKITMKRAGTPQVVFNDRSLFHVEHFRAKEFEVEASNETDAEVKTEGEGEQVVLATPEPKVDRSWFEQDDESMFEERWKSWTDTKPKGKHQVVQPEANLQAPRASRSTLPSPAPSTSTVCPSTPLPYRFRRPKARVRTIQSPTDFGTSTFSSTRQTAPWRCTALSRWSTHTARRAPSACSTSSARRRWWMSFTPSRVSAPTG